jgi:hypothetical protein
MGTGIFSSFALGWWIALRHPLLILCKWLLNLSFAFVLVFPVAGLIKTDLNHSLRAEALESKIPADYLIEFVHHYADQLSGISAYYPLLFLVFALCNIFLSGGILEFIQSDERPGWGRFLPACGYRSPPLIFSTFLSGVLFVMLVAFPLMLMGMLLRFLRNYIPDAMLIFYVQMGSLLLILLLFTAVVRVHDYARLLVTRPGATYGGLSFMFSIKSFAKAILFTRRYHVATFILMALFLIVHGVVIWLHGEALPRLDARLGGGYWLALGLGQLLILARVTTSLATMAGQSRFVNSRLFPVVPISEPEPEPEAEENVAASKETTESDEQPWGVSAWEQQGDEKVEPEESRVADPKPVFANGEEREDEASVAVSDEPDPMPPEEPETRDSMADDTSSTDVIAQPDPEQDSSQASEGSIEERWLHQLESGTSEPEPHIPDQQAGPMPEDPDPPRDPETDNSPKEK